MAENYLRQSPLAHLGLAGRTAAARGEACVAMRWAGPAAREAGPAAGLAPDPSPPEAP